MGQAKQKELENEQLAIKPERKRWSKLKIAILIQLGALCLYIIFASMGYKDYLRYDRNQALGDVADEKVLAASESIEERKETEYKNFEKQFRSGFYLNDYTNEKKKLDEFIAADFTEKISKESGKEFFLVVDGEYFSGSLDAYKNKQVSAAEFVSKPNEHVWNLKVTMMIPNDCVGDLELKFRKAFDKCIESQLDLGVRKTRCQIVLVEPELQRNHYKKIRESVNPVQYYYENTKKVIFFMYSSDFKNADVSSVNDMDVKVLNAKYKQEFVLKGYYTIGNKIPQTMYALKDKPNISFVYEYVTSADKYLTVLAQKAMHEDIESILKEEGLDKNIVHWSIPFQGDHTMPIDKKVIDMSKGYTNEEIVSEIFKGYYNVVLNVLVDGEDTSKWPNKEKLARALSRIQARVMKDKSNPSIDFFVKVYKVKPLDVANLKYLFDRDWNTEHYMRPELKLSDIIAKTSYDREETEGFHYLEILGEKVNETRVMGYTEDLINRDVYSGNN